LAVKRFTKQIPTGRFAHVSPQSGKIRLIARDARFATRSVFHENAAGVMYPDVRRVRET